eukprot:2804220-Pyramimonas_sp.AAC.1
MGAKAKTKAPKAKPKARSLAASPATAPLTARSVAPSTPVTPVKPRSDPAQEPTPSPVAATQEQQLAELSTVNAGLWAKVAEWVGIVKNNPAFMDIETAAALDISGDMDDESGFQDAFNESKFDTAMTRTNKYRSAQNLFHHNIFQSASPGMPIRESAVNAYMEFYFQTPTPIPSQIVVALANGMHPIKNSQNAFRMSPDEPVIAWFKRVATLIKDGAGEDELLSWRKAALQTGFEYHRVENEETIYFRSKQFRQNVEEDYTQLRQTVV